MKKEALSLFPHLNWSIAAFVIFCIVFVGLLFWVYRRGSSQHYGEISKFPIGEEKK